MRRGLTLTEVVITLAVLGVLLALVFSAVAKVRTAAARMTCSNNLYVLGITIHNYHDANNHFPPGTLPNSALPPDQRFSFLLVLLPYTEATNLYALLEKQQPWDSERNVGLVAHGRFKLYQCPSWIRTHGYDANLVASGHLAITNYVGVAGVGSDAATRPADAPGIGFFGYDRTIKREDVKDGLHQTAMIFETAREPGPWIRGGPSTVRAVGESATEFGGTHFRTSWTFQKRDAGFYVLLADGAQQFTKPNVDPAVLAAIATIAGREEIPADW